MQELSPFLLTILSNIIIAISILIIVFFIKFFKKKIINYLEYVTATTVWLLLALIFLWFIPELIYSWFDWKSIWLFILIWIIFFYLLELFLHWHHCKDLDHSSNCNSSHTYEHKNWILMFGATIMHNSFHWIVIFWAFSFNFHFWIVTTIAILLHSIPQNIINYIMNHNNIKYSYFAAIWWLLWVLLIFPFTEFLISKESYILSIICWGLLYTALTDIFPEFKWKWTMIKKISYLFFIIIWIWIFFGFNILIK